MLLKSKIKSFLIIIFCLVFWAFFSSGAQATDNNLDSDSDGLTDYQEIHIYHTDATNPDTDGDSYTDGEEVAHGYSPTHRGDIKLSNIDTDSDDLNDALEIALGTDLLNPDTDGDDYSDYEEVMHGFNPLKGDHDESLPRKVEVDLSKQQMTYYLNNVKIATAPISSGTLSTPTPNGTFKIEQKKLIVHYKGPGYDLPNTKWNLLFNSKKGLFLHGAYWHNQFGIKPMSHGCVNISYPDAEKLYAFLKIGDEVKVFGKTPTKPLTN